jgi:uncharacterized membrane protein YwzB
MFEKLQQKWKVSGWRLLLILLTFAVGGSLTGWAGKKIMNALGIEQPIIYIIVYILLITLIWPAAVMLISIPFGQALFFKKYILRLYRRLFHKNTA